MEFRKKSIDAKRLLSSYLSCMSSIVWFRQDLRLEDHYALMTAVSRGEPLLLVYVFEETRHWGVGRAAKWWLEASLKEFKASIEKKGGHLTVLRGKSAEAIEMLIVKHKVTHLYYGNCYEPEERKIEKEVGTVCKRHGVLVESFHHNLLYNPETLLTKEGKPFQVYTPFWNASQKFGPPEFPLPSPKSLSSSIKETSLSISALELHQSWDLHEIPQIWEPGANGAQKRLHAFGRHDQIPLYAHARDFPAIQGTSKLSPHLHLGEISPRTVWHATTGSVVYHKELLWREFAKHLLYHFPHTTDHSLKPAFENFPWQKNNHLLKAWQKGETGYPIVDAGMRELWHTGWMHNRVRMIVASFLIKDLRIHWLEGAKWFWDCLVDADLASNTLGWQWSAGCGADAAPFFRIFHPDLQQAKFDPTQAYTNLWVPHPSPRIVDHKEARIEALKAYHSLRE